MHGASELYVSGYSNAELETWAEKIKILEQKAGNVSVYFDNDAKVEAPKNAKTLVEIINH